MKVAPFQTKWRVELLRDPDQTGCRAHGEKLGRRGSSALQVLDGSVLIVVLWACLGLVSVALMFGHAMLMTYRGADNDLSGRQAEQAIDGSARYVEALMAAVTTPGEIPDAASFSSEAVPVGDATVWVLGRSSGASTTAGATRTYGLVDEASKLNLNTATLAMLKALPQMTEELAAAIIDWRDADDEVTSGGAESETYLRKTPGYACKNAPFESVEELALVNGATRDILYGGDANLNGVPDAEEGGNQTTTTTSGGTTGGLLDYVTVFSRESNKRADGTARIDVSQPGEELTELLTTTFSADRAQQIRQRLGGPPLRSELEFYIRSGMTAEEFAQIADAITTTKGNYIPGRVNVNTASEAVLACIPGIGTDKAATLVAARAGRTPADTNVAWVIETLGPGAIQAGPFITAKSFQVSADIAAVGRHGRGYRRAKFVIDSSTGTPRIIYRRNLAPLGWALGSEVRQTLALQKEGR